MPVPAPRTSSWQSLRRAAVGGLIVSLVSATTANAAGMIRDAETESLIKTYAKPILNAAGLSGQAVEIHIVNDRAFNAFVIDGHNMYDAAVLYKRFRQWQQIWKFGLDSDEVAAFVGQYGWQLVEQAAADYYLQNYIRPTGRDLTASDLEWSAYCTKR